MKVKEEWKAQFKYSSLWMLQFYNFV